MRKTLSAISCLSRNVTVSRNSRRFSLAANQALSLRNLAQNLPESSRERQDIYNAARDLMIRAENKKDALHRLTDAHEINVVSHVGIDLGIFRTLARNSEKAIHVNELSQAAQADATLMLRILRFLAANGLIEQVSNDSFKASSLTMTLAEADAEHTIRMNTMMFQPVMNKLPAFLRETKYQNPVDPCRSVWQYHFGTKLPLFEWLGQHPEELFELHHVISKMRVNQRSWCDGVVPMERLQLSAADATRGRVAFVDVGGGTGHQSMLLREKHPHLGGRVILEELPQVVSLLDAEKLKAHNIDILPHDFFAPQPQEVHGAKAFYLRNVLHDWPDDKAVEILRHLRSAMADDSILMIDEIAMPEKGAHTRPVHYDMIMLASCASMERSERQWKELLFQAGLEMTEVWSLHEDTHDSLIAARPI